jgi:hypothetical protein
MIPENNNLSKILLKYARRYNKHLEGVFVTPAIIMNIVYIKAEKDASILFYN